MNASEESVQECGFLSGASDLICHSERDRVTDCNIREYWSADGLSFQCVLSLDTNRFLRDDQI